MKQKNVSEDQDDVDDEEGDGEGGSGFRLKKENMIAFFDCSLVVLWLFFVFLSLRYTKNRNIYRYISIYLLISI
jgi:hypothetical protein